MSQTGLKLPMEMRIAEHLILLSLSARITGVCHAAWFTRCWESNLGICACLTNTLPSELYPQSLGCCS